MSPKRLIKTVLLAGLITAAFSSCCCISRRLGAYDIGPDAPIDVSPPINGDWTHRAALSEVNCD